MLPTRISPSLSRANFLALVVIIECSGNLMYMFKIGKRFTRLATTLPTLYHRPTP